MRFAARKKKLKKARHKSNSQFKSKTTNREHLNFHVARGSSTNNRGSRIAGSERESSNASRISEYRIRNKADNVLQLLDESSTYKSIKLGAVNGVHKINSPIMSKLSSMSTKSSNRNCYF